MPDKSGGQAQVIVSAAGDPVRRPSRRQSDLAHVARISGTLASATYSRGSLAALRRGSPDSLLHEPAFHRLILPIDDGELTHSGELRWAVAVQGIALLSSPGQKSELQQAGALLAGAGYSEQRLARLLASSGSAIHDQVLLACRFLRGRRVGGMPMQLFELALAEHQPRRLDRLRFECAREYYRVVDRVGSAKDADTTDG